MDGLAFTSLRSRDAHVVMAMSLLRCASFGCTVWGRVALASIAHRASHWSSMGEVFSVQQLVVGALTPPMLWLNGVVPPLSHPCLSSGCEAHVLIVALTLAL